MKMQDSTAIKIAAIAAITVLEGAALIVMHIDGVLLATAVAIIGGIAGYELKSIKMRKESGESNEA